MPVNTAALKTFAPAMRRQLLEAVGRKLDLLLHSQTPDTLSTYSKQIAELREQEAENREQLLERVAYTWFNRLCALRYIDARGWHPFGCKVLMPAAEGETQPELLKLMRAGSLPAELKPHTNEARLHGLLDGQIPPAISGADPQGEVYRELVLASCRSYHQLLPELFEGLDDASELLLPDDLLSEGSIAGAFRSEISDADCADVEIIGWLYQFYISEKKDQVIGKVVKSEDIPAATQLFTPNWIVKYMVQNTLGATWLATYPDSLLKGTMEFYIEPAEQTPQVQTQLEAITPESLDPEALTLIDPACGSGHILVEAYDLLKAIYLERGYRQRDIPELILSKNLYGLDICPRAVQLATFSLLMKGREDDRRLLERRITLNMIAFQDSTGFNAVDLTKVIGLENDQLCPKDFIALNRLFEHAATVGSLIQIPNDIASKLDALEQACKTERPGLFYTQALQYRLLGLVRAAKLLARKYDTVVANPPYMARKYAPSVLRRYAERLDPDLDRDLYTVSIARYFLLCQANGRIGAMTPFTWMFLSAHREFRIHLLDKHSLATLVQLEYSGFEGATVPICTFTAFCKALGGYKSSHIRLSDFAGARNQPVKTLEAIKNPNCGWLYRVANSDFGRIPEQPLAYWVSERVRLLFENSPSLEEVATPRSGITTGNNDYYLRHWHELDIAAITFDVSGADDPRISSVCWVPISGGSNYRKWAGSQSQVIRWHHGGQELRSDAASTIANMEYQFKPGVTWTKITSALLSVRITGEGYVFTAVGLKAFPAPQDRLYVAAFLNSKVVEYFKPIFSSTMSILSGAIAKLPLVMSPNRAQIEANTLLLAELSEKDWLEGEQFWGFRSDPLLLGSCGNNLKERWLSRVESSKARVLEMKSLEQLNNIHFIEAYGLQEELSADVPLEQITLNVNPAYRYGGNSSDLEQWDRFRRDTMAEFLSYATGCMMGRYSLDQPGLILADCRDSQAEQLAAYEAKVGKPLSEVQFKPDPDGIIPVLDGEWFEDDIVARSREFLEVTFPESSVAENMRFIEESLGKDIRKYFCSEFYKDHLQTYKKRPIYWMVQSPKKGFSCLIYLHRYTKDTLNQVLNNYFRPYLQKLEARLAQLGLDQLNDDLPTRERTAARKEAEKITKVVKECQAWEQDALLPLAQQRIPLDLDDGVKVNYLKLQDVLAPIPGLAAKED